MMSCFVRTLGALMSALMLVSAGAPALAAGPADPARFRLTPALLDRMEALRSAAETMGKATDDVDVETGSVQELARELEADPRVRSLLARHGVTSTDYATGVFAVLHAGLFLAMASAANPAQQASAMASFTPEQRANIELMRKRQKAVSGVR